MRFVLGADFAARTMARHLGAALRVPAVGDPSPALAS
jgi:hypothetical protein